MGEDLRDAAAFLGYLFGFAVIMAVFVAVLWFGG